MSFAVARKRSVVHKRSEANSARVLVLKHNKMIQLVGFFKDYSLGSCMNFVLKVTDNLEIFSRSGGFFLRINDAKYCLPRGEAQANRDFVCLEMPEYPAEHDDITIGFETESGTPGFVEK